MNDKLIELATPEEITRAAHTAERAFAADPLMPYLLPKPEGRAERALWYYEGNIRHAVLYGEAYATPGFEGLAAWLNPGQDNWSYDKLSHSGMTQLAEKLGDGAWRRMMRLVNLPMPEPPEPHWYLLLLGVDPDHQRQGLGHRLLVPLLAQADAGGETIRLETNNAASLPFYRKEGFEVVYEGHVDHVIDQWAMERKARSG